MRQLKRASDLTKEFLKDSEYQKLYEEVAHDAELQQMKNSRLSNESNTWDDLILTLNNLKLD